MKAESARRRGGVAVAMLIALVVLQLVIVGLVTGGARDNDLMSRRAQTVRAVYAAEAGMNMAVRELMNGADEDGDGGVGSISDDGNAANDPTFVAASVVVKRVVVGVQTTLRSEGRCGDSRRTLEALTE